MRNENWKRGNGNGNGNGHHYNFVIVAECFMHHWLLEWYCIMTLLTASQQLMPGRSEGSCKRAKRLVVTFPMFDN